jgi:hypothetical protein
MAVLDKFANSDIEDGKHANPNFAGGAKVLAIIGSYELAAADDDASVVRIGRVLANYIPIFAQITCDAITAMTDLDVGLYKPGVGGAVVDADLFADGLNLNAGVTIVGNLANNGFTTQPTIENIGETIWQLLGLSVPNRQDYDLALTWNTIGSAAGTVSWRFLFAHG